MLPHKNREMMGVAEVAAKYGVQPGQFCDYQALIGDSAVSMWL